MVLNALHEELKNALKEKDSVKISRRRVIVSALHNKEIELHAKEQKLEEKDEMDVLKKELKKRKEAARAFETAGRKEMAEKESAEAAYIETLLPTQLSEADVEKNIDEVLIEMGAVTNQDFGKIMKAVMAKSGGAADGSMVSRMIKEKLA